MTKKRRHPARLYVNGVLKVRGSAPEIKDLVKTNLSKTINAMKKQ